MERWILDLEQRQRESPGRKILTIEDLEDILRLIWGKREDTGPRRESNPLSSVDSLTVQPNPSDPE